MNSKICPACQSISAIDAAFCGRCGHHFQTAFVASQSQAPRLYTLVADNGQRYGPVELQGVQGWVTSGMLLPLSKLQTNDGQFALAKDFPELAGLFPAVAGPGLAPLDWSVMRRFASSPVFGGILTFLGFFWMISAISRANSPAGQLQAALGGDSGLTSILFGLFVGLFGVVILLYGLTQRK